MSRPFCRSLPLCPLLQVALSCSKLVSLPTTASWWPSLLVSTAISSWVFEFSSTVNTRSQPARKHLLAAFTLRNTPSLKVAQALQMQCIHSNGWRETIRAAVRESAVRRVCLPGPPRSFFPTRLSTGPSTANPANRFRLHSPSKSSPETPRFPVYSTFPGLIFFQCFTSCDNGTFRSLPWHSSSHLSILASGISERYRQAGLPSFRRSWSCVTETAKSKSDQKRNHYLGRDTYSVRRLRAGMVWFLKSARPSYVPSNLHFDSGYLMLGMTCT